MCRHTCVCALAWQPVSTWRGSQQANLDKRQPSHAKDKKYKMRYSDSRGQVSEWVPLGVDRCSSILCISMLISNDRERTWRDSTTKQPPQLLTIVISPGLAASRLSIELRAANTLGYAAARPKRILQRVAWEDLQQTVGFRPRHVVSQFLDTFLRASCLGQVVALTYWPCPIHCECLILISNYEFNIINVFFYARKKLLILQSNWHCRNTCHVQSSWFDRGSSKLLILDHRILETFRAVLQKLKVL